jgi:hypothetical protein
VTALEEPGPVVLLRADAENSLATRFQAGRALGLLLQHATILERVGPDDLAPLFACAALIAGVALPAGLPKPPEDLLRTVARAVGAQAEEGAHAAGLALQLREIRSRGLARRLLRTADRLGLMMAGDVGASALTLVGGGADDAVASAADVATNPAALDLLRFALGEQYPSLRKVVA